MQARDDAMTEVAEAEQLILSRMRPFATRRTPLADALGGVLREDVLAERDQPPFDRVTMDGIAIRHDDWATGTRVFTIVGTQAAGAPPLARSAPGECVEVMTGAMLPAGCDSIIPVERINIEAHRARVDDDAKVAARQFVHLRGSDRGAGAVLAGAGTIVGPAEIAVLASAGYTEVALAAVPRIAVISTGDELVDVDEPVAAYQIRSTNDRAIEASLCRRRLARVERVRLKDEPDTLLDEIAQLHAANDGLILSGGVSMGQYDFVPGVLRKLGVQMVFHRIEQRPGRPMWFGVSRDRKPVFALPGNPVSTLVCLTRYVQPALRRSLGLPAVAFETARLEGDVDTPADLTYFMPVALGSSTDGVLTAEPRPTNTSGDFVALVGTDGIAELPRGRDGWPAGALVRVFRW